MTRNHNLSSTLQNLKERVRPHAHLSASRTKIWSVESALTRPYVCNTWSPHLPWVCGTHNSNPGLKMGAFLGWNATTIHFWLSQFITFSKKMQFVSTNNSFKKIFKLSRNISRPTGWETLPSFKCAKSASVLPSASTTYAWDFSLFLLESAIGRDGMYRRKFG